MNRPFLSSLSFYPKPAWLNNIKIRRICKLQHFLNLLQIIYCGGEIGATQHVVWSRAPGQTFLRSGTWRVTVFQQCSYVDKQAGKTRRSNSILYEEYETVLFNIIVISYLVLFFWAIL
jgi:hypothetical protein